jgi:mRNA-degrading endonuclease RelE of RelBE toxin-antitoxin system
MEVQLRDEPNVVTRRRKILDRVAPGFEHIPPLWELRVGEFRIFYDVDLSAGKVYVRAVRRKRVDQITEEIIK